MNEWFKKTFQTIKEKWGKWTIVQKSILFGIIAVIIVALVLLFTMSSRQTSVRLFNSPVTDSARRAEIQTRLDEEHVWNTVDSSGYILVENSEIARRWQSQLVKEGLEPDEKDPWSLFDVTRYSRNSMDDRVNWLRSRENSLKNHLESLPGIRTANVALAIPETTVFSDDQAPVEASVILFPKAGSDVLDTKKSVKGIQHLIMRSVENLREENITIFNGDTNEEINDFAGLEAVERNTIIANQQKLIKKLEAEDAAKILKQLQSDFGSQRVATVNVSIEMDMSEKSSVSEEYGGITIKEDNPDTPYDDSEVVQSLVISEQVVDKKWTGTGFNPEGVAGVEGQNPPVYSDADNLIGQSTENGATRNYALNKKTTTETVSPQKERRSVSVSIKSLYVYPLYDENHKIRFDEDGLLAYREEKLSDEDLKKVENLVKGSINFNAKRGDSVVVENLSIPPTEALRDATNDYLRKQRTKTTIMLILIGVVALLVFFIIFRFVSREIERRRRLKQEELLRQQQAAREKAIWDANENNMEITLSVEERKRAELQENAIAMAKEHPEDVAMLIRTWLMEE